MYVICIDNNTFETQLTLNKCYRVIKDEQYSDFYYAIDNDNKDQYFGRHRFSYFLTFSQAVNVADKQGLKIQCCDWKTNQMYVIVHIRPDEIKELELHYIDSLGSYKTTYIPTISDILSSWIVLD